MKKIVFVLAFVFSKILFGQTSFDYLQKGLTKQKQNNLKGAIKDYNTAIRKDRSNMVAYYNRGYCEFLLKKYKSSFYDLKKVTELDPNFVRAYVLRAKIYSHFNEDSAALPDLDKAIELNPTFPHVLTLRGKIRVATGNQQGACEDFNRAKLIDDKEADQLLFLYCTNGKPTPESFLLEWPINENWVLGSCLDSLEIVVKTFIHPNETPLKRKEYGRMILFKGLTNRSLEQSMQSFYKTMRRRCSKTRLTLLEKDASSEHPYIIFKLETPKINLYDNPESTLYYIVQGKSCLFVNQLGTKQPTIPEDLKNKWIRFFKTGKIVTNTISEQD